MSPPSLYATFLCVEGTARGVHPPEGNQMKSSTKDQIRGKLHEVKGTVKEKAGQVTNNPDLEADGRNEKVTGTVQKKIGQIEKVFDS